MGRFYLLDENKIPFEVSLQEGMKLYEDMLMKIVQQDNLDNAMFISTVFLGLDHSLPFLHNNYNERPVLFETMIFDKNGDDIYMERYYTYQEALESHNKLKEEYANKN